MLCIYPARDAVVVQKTSVKFKNASEPSPTTSVNYKAEQAEGKPFRQKEKEVQRLGNMGMTANKAFSSKFGKPPKQMHPLI